MHLIARIVSIVFHPLLMLTYMLLLMLVVNPYMFGYQRVVDGDALILMVFLSSVFIPLVAILVMKGLGWLSSFEMPQKQERIGPYIVSAVLYLSLYLHLAKTKSFPVLLLVCVLGTVIALFAGFFFNNFRKVSMHGTAVGGLLVMTGLLYARFSTDWFLMSVPFMGDYHIQTVSLLYVVILIAGIVCTSRMLVGKHTAGEIYTGCIIGMVSMWVAYLALA